jgi:hypothetical protein
MTLGVLQSDLFLGKTGARTIFNIQYESARDIGDHSYYQVEFISYINYSTLSTIHFATMPVAKRRITYGTLSSLERISTISKVLERM